MKSSQAWLNHQHSHPHAEDMARYKFQSVREDFNAEYSQSQQVGAIPNHSSHAEEAIGSGAMLPIPHQDSEAVEQH